MKNLALRLAVGAVIGLLLVAGSYTIATLAVPGVVQVTHWYRFCGGVVLVLAAYGVWQVVKATVSLWAKGLLVAAFLSPFVFTGVGLSLVATDDSHLGCDPQPKHIGSGYDQGQTSGCK